MKVKLTYTTELLMDSSERTLAETQEEWNQVADDSNGELELVGSSLEELMLWDKVQPSVAEVAAFMEWCNSHTTLQQAAAWFWLDVTNATVVDWENFDVSGIDIVDGSLVVAATIFADTQFLAECEPIVRRFFDYGSFADYLENSGDFLEFEFGGNTYVVTNANTI